MSIQPHTKRAIILAAGVGRRLRAALAADTPKCLVDMGGRSLLALQLAQLRAVGVDDVLVVVGHRSELVRHEAETVAGTDMRVRFIDNPKHATTNTLVSFALTASWMDRAFFGLNGDVVFSQRLLGLIRSTSSPVALAVEAKACGEEEVKVVIDHRQRVSTLGKALAPKACAGEFVGVAHFDAVGAAAFGTALTEGLTAPDAETAYFEAAIEPLCPRLDVHAVLLPPDEPVIEIDFPQDLIRARADILPRVEALDRCDR